MRKTLTLLVLLVTSQFASANYSKNITCLAKSIYHEARSESKKEWLLVANVAVNRLKHYKKYGAKQQTLCSIVSSKQYTSAAKLKQKIKEKAVYKKILATLHTNGYSKLTKAVYFSSHKGKLKFKHNWR